MKGLASALSPWHPAGMRLTCIALLVSLVAALVAGCASAPPAEVTQALSGNLESLKLAEGQLLPLVPNGDPIDFSQVGAKAGESGPERLYRPRDGWRILLRTYQVRAASLVAWANGEPFDEATATKALVLPALEQARRNLSDE